MGQRPMVLGSVFLLLILKGYLKRLEWCSGPVVARV